ncbi:MAG: hypothetical protein JF591_19520 [Lysobacter sp.]|nr:hypothetical protein [Lysobacter sp.]
MKVRDILMLRSVMKVRDILTLRSVMKVRDILTLRSVMKVHDILTLRSVMKVGDVLAVIGAVNLQEFRGTREACVDRRRIQPISPQPICCSQSNTAADLTSQERQSTISTDFPAP